MTLGKAKLIIQKFKTVKTEINPIETISTDWEYEFDKYSATKPFKFISKKLNLSFQYQKNIHSVMRDEILTGKLTLLNGKISINGESRIGFTKDGFMLGSEIEFAEDIVNTSIVEPIKSRDFEEGYIYRASNDKLFYYIGKTRVLSTVFNAENQQSRANEFGIIIKKELNASHFFREVEVSEDTIKFIGSLTKSNKKVFMVTQENEITNRFTPRYLKLASLFGNLKLGAKGVHSWERLMYPDLKVNSELVNIKDLSTIEINFLKETQHVGYIYKFDGEFYSESMQNLREYNKNNEKKGWIYNKVYHSKEEENTKDFTINGLDFKVRDFFLKFSNLNIYNHKFYEKLAFNVRNENYTEVFEKDRKFAKVFRPFSELNIKDCDVFISII